MVCTRCGAANSEGAKWCSLCLERFELVKPAASTQVSTEASVKLATAGEAPPASGKPLSHTPVDRGPVHADGVNLTWICPSCDTENEMTQDRCTVCGTSLRSLFEPPKPPPSVRDVNPNVAAAMSLVPGAGHFYLGKTAQGVLRIALGFWWLLAAIIASGENIFLDIIQFVHFLAFIGLVAVCVLDARALAIDAAASQFLTPKVVRNAVLALLAASLLGGFVGALTR